MDGEAGLVSAERWSYHYFMRDEDQQGDPNLYSEECYAKSLNKVVCTGSYIFFKYSFVDTPLNTLNSYLFLL